MDSQTLKSLLDALRVSPANTGLLKVILEAYLESEQKEQALNLLREHEVPATASAQERQTAARVLLANDLAADALEFVQDDVPESLLMRARAHWSLGEIDQARRAYHAAIEANPTLEDDELANMLHSRVRTLPSGGQGKPMLRVISNDDTSAIEAQRALVPSLDKITFAEVGGLDAIKEQIRKRIILPFQKPSLFKRFRKRVGGGILLYGPPGCGKTLLARATAGECNATFLNVAISDVLDMYIGESEQKLHALFEKARTSTPAVLFFDEIEALGGKRQFTREATSSKLVSQFLSEMDGFAQNNQGVLILGATNVPWAVDAAFRRPGRFDRVLFVPPPDREARLRILEILLENRPTQAQLDLQLLATSTSGFSGADLENLVEQAADEAIDDSLESGKELPITQEHLKRALKQIKPTTLEWLTTARNYARYANEAGHYDEVLEFLSKHGKG